IRKYPGFQPCPVLGKPDDLGPAVVLSGLFLEAVILCKSDVPMTLVPIDPGGRTNVYTETVALHRFHRPRIKNFDGTGHGNIRKIGVRTVQQSLSHHTTVEVMEYPRG